MADDEIEIKNSSRLYGLSVGDTNFSNTFNQPYPPLTPSDYKLLHPPSMESQIQKLLISMENWKELVVKINSILLWEKQWHPTALVGGSTVFFMLLWLVDPNMLTILSLLGLIVTVADYVLPSMAASLFKNESWSTQKQKQLDDFCTNVILYKTKSELLFASYYRMRATNPKLYFGITFFALSMLAWLGSAFNNMFLMYVIVTISLLLPGMEHNGMLAKWTTGASKIFNDMVDNAKTKIGQKKIQ